MKKIVVLFLINILLVWIYILYPNTKLSLQFNDIYYKFNKNTPNKEIVFLQIGEKSINKFGRWPWSREIFAKEIAKITNSKVIILDMVFSEKTKDDNVLANIISQKPTICGFFLRDKATQNIDEEKFDILSNSSINLTNIQLVSAKFAEVSVEPILSSCALNAIFSTLIDKDNLYRRYVAAYLYNSLIFPTLGVQALRFYYNQEIDIKNHILYIKNKKIPLDKFNALKLNYYPLNKYQIISFSDIDKFNFKDKIVIIGISESGISDIRSTPIGPIPGPLLHYTFISNILNSDYIKEYKSLNILFMIFSMLVAFSYFFKSITKRVLIYFSTILVFIIGAIFLYRFFNIMIDIFYPLLSLIVNILIIEFFLFKEKENQVQFIKQAFQSYLSPSLLEEIIKNPNKLQLGGEEKEITILFTDIRNFTTLSENSTPKEIIQLINKLFSILSHVIIDNKGFIDKYIGDAIMALFNAPVDVKNHAQLACKSAIEMQLAINEFNQTRKNLPPIHMGIGINTDKVYVGNMGSDIKFEYSALGDGVNIASRLEGETKKLDVKILISKNTYNKIDTNLFHCTYKGRIYVKGKSKPIEVYSLDGYKGKYI